MLSSRGFDIIDCSKIDVLGQMSIFANAKVVVSPHGAGLTNIIFSRGGHLVELINSEALHSTSFRHLAHLSGSAYSICMGLGSSNDKRPNIKDRDFRLGNKAVSELAFYLESIEKNSN
jgi:capsular polysaccharide biosynthesis protein